MKTFKKISMIGAAMFLAVSVSSVYAGDGDMTQSRDRTQTYLTVGDLSKAQNRNQNRYQHQYNVRNNYQTQASSSMGSSMSRQMNSGRSGSGGRR